MPARKAPPLSDQEFARFRALVLARSGLEIPDRRRTELERLVARTSVETGAPDTAALYRSLAAGPAVKDEPSPLNAFVDRLTIGETHFFRNRPQFRALERRILPEVIERRRAARRLRIWSAGCASGEEPYSLAILVQRLLPDLPAWDVLILATDVNRDALAKARLGSYGPRSFREVPAGVQEACFTRRGDRFELRPDVRDMVTFHHQNLAGGRLPSLRARATDMDLILCRNVLMYLAPAVADGVLARLDAALVPDGWLLLGPADPSPVPSGPFTTLTLEGAIVHRKAGVGTVPATPARTRPPAKGRRTAGAVRPHRSRTRPAHGAALAAAPPAVPAEPVDHADVDGAYGEAKRHAGRGRLDDADRLLGSLLDRSPLLAPAHYLRGLVAQERGDPDAAMSAFRRAIYADPGFVLAHVALGNVCVALGRTRAAGRALDAAMALLEHRDPGDVIDEGDGLTVGRLAELVILQRARTLRPAG